MGQIVWDGERKVEFTRVEYFEHDERKMQHPNRDMATDVRMEKASESELQIK